MLVIGAAMSPCCRKPLSDHCCEAAFWLQKKEANKTPIKDLGVEFSRFNMQQCFTKNISPSETTPIFSQSLVKVFGSVFRRDFLSSVDYRGYGIGRL